MCFTHLTSQWSPFYTYTMLTFCHIQLLSQPRPQTQQMDILNRTRTFTWTYQRIIHLSTFQTYPTRRFILCRNRHNLISWQIFIIRIIDTLP